MKISWRTQVKILLVTEKCSPEEIQRDGGARLVNTMRNAFGDSLSIMQFGACKGSLATWHFSYPFDMADRFERRIANASFIIEQVKTVEHDYTHVIFIHISMQFGLAHSALRAGLQVWTFPMFLTPSYRLAGETVPDRYLALERLSLFQAQNIVTPSYLEKDQLVSFYSVPESRIHVIPRGVDTHLLDPKIRFFQGLPLFCSIGSIKPQKNILGLVQLFNLASRQFPGARLKIIGPVQNRLYYQEVKKEIRKLGLEENIQMTGYVPPERLAAAVQDAHLHLSASTCETFGRSIFETLACGLPNIARCSGNAAAGFLRHLPYARFTDSNDEALTIIHDFLGNLSQLSSMALEISTLYDDKRLSRLLVAKIGNRETLAVSDFDGTLFHKQDTGKTRRSIIAFSRFQPRIVCSARPLPDLLDQLKVQELEVDWIIAYGGAVVANGSGKILWSLPLGKDLAHLEKCLPQAQRIQFKGEVLQICIPAPQAPQLSGYRIEIYQDTAFIASWKASKLRAVLDLLNSISWTGQVLAFGDGPYDRELLDYFDGIHITPTPQTQRQRKEIGHG